MLFYRFIKPDWGKPSLTKDGDPNENFKVEIQGPNSFDGMNFTKDYIDQCNRSGYNCYFFPNRPSRDVFTEDGIRFLNAKHIDVFEYVFVDMDLKDGVYSDKEAFLNELRKFPIKPHMTVDSGNGIHSYWKISNLTRDAYVFTQLALIEKFNTDQSVWSVCQLMRVPNTFNTKIYGHFKQVQFVDDLTSGETISLQSLVAHLPKPSEESINRGQYALDKLDGKVKLNLGTDVDIDSIPEKFILLKKHDDRIEQLFDNPKGDRSVEDFRLCHQLFDHGFDYNEALAVISNTQKARDKGDYRETYARTTVEKVYTERPKNKFESVSVRLRNRGSELKQKEVNGPYFLDSGVLGEPWRKHELLGIIGGTGVGKTAFALNTLFDIMKNNPDSDEVFVFFSLEMTKDQVVSRWTALVGEDPSFCDRLFVVDTEEEGLPKIIGLQEMYEYCRELKQVTGRGIGAVVIDHFHIISTHIDSRKSPSFGIDSEQGTGYGDVKNLSLNGLATQLKMLVKLLDTFGIVLTQTTKEKGVGDLPISKDGAYGISHYEWIMDRIVTLWQPLLRVQEHVRYRFLAFQYVKIREKRETDRLRENEPKLLTYDMGTGLLKSTTPHEYEEFKLYIEAANEKRAAAMSKKGSSYSILDI